MVAGTRSSISPLVEWDPREYNSLTDHAANVALDIKEDWSRADWEKMGSAKRKHAYLRLCVHDALRGDGSSAAGLALLPCATDGSEVLLCRAGRVMARLGSAFVAELLALEWGVHVLTTFLYKDDAQMVGTMFFRCEIRQVALYSWRRVCVLVTLARMKSQQERT